MRPAGDIPELFAAFAPDVESADATEEVDDECVEVEGLVVVDDGKGSVDCVSVWTMVFGCPGAPPLLLGVSVTRTTGGGPAGVGGGDVEVDEGDAAAADAVLEVEGNSVVTGAVDVSMTVDGLLEVTVVVPGLKENDVGVVVMPGKEPAASLVDDRL